jgi:GNAT superfamily N-acetyltransferase
MNYAVKKLAAATRGDFWRVHCDANDASWCCCVAWWVPTWEGFGDRTAEQNRQLRELLFDRGEFDGYVLYGDGQPIAWCQAGQRDRLLKLCAQYGLAPAPQTWAITCFVVPPANRGQGIADRLLAGVLADLASRGVTRVEAFPRAGAGLPADEVWTGPERLFRKHGFETVKDDPAGPVLVRDLAGGSRGTG